MSTLDSKFNAAPSAAGYFYQARLALAFCLQFANNDSTIEVSIERLDDVAFEKNGTPLELLQTKHHISKIGELTNLSPDLWKTLRIWSEAILKEPALATRTRFLLLTTASAPNDENEAAYLLRPSITCGLRNIEKAEEVLLKAAANSKSTSLKPCFDAFKNLTPEMRKALLNSIDILDRSPQLSDLDKIIEQKIAMLTTKEKKVVAREMLEGWWWDRICNALQENPVGSVSILELESKLDDIRESLKKNALPEEIESFSPTSSELEAYNNWFFVKQLQAVDISTDRINYAKRDYYRAFTQRSKWARQNLIFDGEVSKFESKLIEEWQPRFSQMCDLVKPGCEEPQIKEAGNKLYQWVENEARYPFRNVTNRSLNVGSYHILANGLKLGWHRDYLTLLDSKEDTDGEH